MTNTLETSMALAESKTNVTPGIWGDLHMFQPWRLRIKQADEAARRGSLEEAARILREKDIKDFLPAVQLRPKVADLLAKRGGERAGQGDFRGAWQDHDLSSELSHDHPELDKLRLQLAEITAREAEARLKAGDAAGSVKELAELDRRGIITNQTRRLREVADKWIAAQTRSRQGDFSQAEMEFATAAALLPGAAVLESQRKQCRQSQDEFRGLSERLHEAMGRGAWTEVLTAADRMLELAPEHLPARAARRRAWSAVGTSVRDPMIGTRLVEKAPMPARTQDTPSAKGAEKDTMTESQPGPRFILWVDAVGGYLVCCGKEVVLGQPVPGSSVDIPILADLSRRHAKIRREGEGYMIQPGRNVKLDGRPVDESALLRDNSLIELGSGVLLRFRKPHALSSTARLEFVSRHRTQPSADGVILMAETCILGPKSHNHVVCRDWSKDVVLSRQQGGLSIRAAGPFEVDGVPCDQRAEITTRSRIEGEDFSFSLEQV